MTVVHLLIFRQLRQTAAALALVGVLAFGVLGCGSGGSSTGTEPERSSVAPTGSETDGSESELSIEEAKAQTDAAIEEAKENASETVEKAKAVASLSKSELQTVKAEAKEALLATKERAKATLEAAKARAREMTE